MARSVHPRAARAAAATLGMLLLAGGSVHAQLYVCTDARGRTVSSDRPPAECADRTVRELRSDGSVRRVIEPPLTPEQKAAKAEEEKRQKVEADKQREQMRRDLALLETYANEDEIEESRNRALAQRQSLIERAQKRLDDHRRERKRLDAELEFYVNRELPLKIKRALETNDTLVRAEERIVRDAKADMVRVNERYDEERKRFQDLVSKGAMPMQRK